MAIEFHCEHCNHLIKAPDDAGGRTGRCPHCHNPTYIPRPVADEGELDLAPLDDTEETKRKQAAMEDAAFKYKLLHERAIPGEPARGGVKQAGQPAFVSTTKAVVSLIVSYVEAMSAGRLDKALEVASELAQRKADALRVLDEMAREDLGAYGLPTLPKPVLQGFLKQLRQQL